MDKQKDELTVDELRYIAELETLIYSLRNSNRKENASVLLIGAGVSKSAGIPVASELVSEVLAKYTYLSKQLKDNHNYNEVMSKISQEERNEIIVPYIKNAKINLAHIAIAQLFKEGYFRRILTVNFDPLLINACALVGMNPLPAIYDVGAVKDVDGDRLIDPCIIYLNGQHTGAVLRNTDEELEEHKQVLQEVIDATGFRSTWLVSGYSGDCDPLFKLLQQQQKFKRGLYWFARKNDSAKKVIADLCCHKKDVKVVIEANADDYFVDLAQALEVFPPEFLVKPFDYVKELAYRVKIETGTEAVKEAYKVFDEQIEKALNAVSDKQQEITQATELLQGNRDNQELLPRFRAVELLDEGNKLFEQKQFLAAAEKYQQALAIKPDFHEAAFNWGIALANEAQAVVKKDKAKAEELWHLAGEKYQQSLAIKPDKYEAFHNWGITLANEAQAVVEKDNAKAEELWSLVGEKFRQVLEIKPDFHEAAFNWGIALANEAQAVVKKDKAKAEELWHLAGEKYQQSLVIKPDDHKVLSSWTNTLIHLYHHTQDTHYLIAGLEKAQLAENIKAGSGAYNLACTYALQNNPEAAIHCLTIAKEHSTLPTQEHISQDKDFDLIRDTPVFQQWWQETFPTPSSINPET